MYNNKDMEREYRFRQSAEEIQGLLDKVGAMPSASDVRQLVDATTVVGVTYEELMALIAAGGLTAGRKYRITDYETIVNNSSSHVRSAGHRFDVIVTATGVDSLSDDAGAAVHEGDEYFAGCDLSKWRLKYSLVPGRYGWASETGKGVIYDMIDERGNRAGYDFKNIQFLRYMLANSGFLAPMYQRETPFLAGLRKIVNNDVANWHCFLRYYPEADIYQIYGDTFDQSLSADGTRMFALIDDTDDAAIIAEVCESKWFYTFVDSFDSVGDPEDASLDPGVCGIEVAPMQFFGFYALPSTVIALQAAGDGGFDGTRVAAGYSTIALPNDRVCIRGASYACVEVLNCDVNAFADRSVVRLDRCADHGASISRSYVDLAQCNLSGAQLEGVALSNIKQSTIYGDINGAEVADVEGVFIGADGRGTVKVFNPADGA